MSTGQRDNTELDRDLSWERSTARKIILSNEEVSYPIITRCLYGPHGLPSFTEGSPYLMPDNLNVFLKSMRV